jgi:outer membrane murein-binding lipoprotein Lpp
MMTGLSWRSAVVAILVLAGVTARGYSQENSSDVKALASRIDQLIEARLAAANIKPAPSADDAEFFRRLNLDLTGKIPNLLDIRDFLDDDRMDKRWIWSEQLVDSEHFAKHFANVLRAIMIAGSNNNQQAQFLLPSFEAWLRQRLERNTGYDRLVYELLTDSPNFNNGVSPSAFYFANENKAENLAGTTSRVFLGVKLECAQCHAHPFAKWTRSQFWEYAVFFAGIQPPRRGLVGGPQPGSSQGPREMKIPGTDKVVKARFLNGALPTWKPGTSNQQTVAEWMIAADNPFFARAAVDHVWSYFFGVSLLEPVAEPNEDGPPAYPELLDELARQFAAHRCDLKFLVRAIVSTRAYQRASVSGGTGDNKEDVYRFARMPVRGLSPEQLFDSVAEATDYQEMAPPPTNRFQLFNPSSVRSQFLARFADQEKRLESQTSILQALFLMNGNFLAERTRLKNNRSLATIASAPRTTSQRIETLYLLVLTRPPRPEELDRLVRYVDSGGPRHDPRQALADVYWALLNSGEFVLNH